MSDLRTKIAETLAGLDGVTAGPWEVIASTRGDWPSVYVRGVLSDGIVAQIMQGVVEDRFRSNAAHIARCDPNFIRQLCEAALAGLEPIPSDWIEWDGKGPPPVDSNGVHIRQRNGTESTQYVHNVQWEHGHGPFDVVAYRVEKHERHN